MNSGWGGPGQKERCQCIPAEEREDKESEDNPLRGQVGPGVPRRKLSSAALRLQRTLLSPHQKWREATMPLNSCRGLSCVACDVKVGREKTRTRSCRKPFFPPPAVIDFDLPRWICFSYSDQLHLLCQPVNLHNQFQDLRG